MPCASAWLVALPFMIRLSSFLVSPLLLFLRWYLNAMAARQKGYDEAGRVTRNQRQQLGAHAESSSWPRDENLGA